MKQGREVSRQLLGHSSRGKTGNLPQQTLITRWLFRNDKHVDIDILSLTCYLFLFAGLQCLEQIGTITFLYKLH